MMHRRKAEPVESPQPAAVPPGDFKRALIDGSLRFAYCACMEKQQTEHEKLDAEMRNIIEEARVILPGVQALFGFQTIAVFNDRFGELETYAKVCHVLGLAMVVVTIAMIMTPAIYYRACAGKPTHHMARTSSVLIRAGLCPLAMGLALEMFTVLFVVGENAWLSGFATLATLLLFSSLWYLMPVWSRKRHQPGNHGV
ncbi:MAG: DUF6328 family protein [Telluria sp.]